jgi:hypothetical protein
LCLTAFLPSICESDLETHNLFKPVNLSRVYLYFSQPKSHNQNIVTSLHNYCKGL